MKKRVFIAALVLVLLMVLVVGTVSAGGGGAYRGEAEDPVYPQLGMIKYLATPAGYHFWFTVNANVSVYVADHSYHNVYQVRVGDPSEWCGPIPVGGSPPRPPYNQVGHEGESVYYKIFDITTDTQICP
jgi:hypothetical protein